MENTIYTTSKKISGFKILMMAVILIGAGKSYGQSENEVSLHVKSPFSMFSYEAVQGEQNLGIGLGLGVNYRYYLNENWSLVTGAEFESFEGSADYDLISDAYQTRDIEGEEFEFRYSIQELSEEQAAHYLNIPLKVQYETTGPIRFFAAGGASIGFDVKSEYRAEAASIVTSGYYAQYDAELHAPEFMGFGEFSNIDNSKKSLDLKTNYVVNLETGIKIFVKNRQAFYVGLFVDYGLKDIGPEKGYQNLITYNPENPMNFMNSSLFTSANKTDAMPYVEEVKTLAYGLKIQYALQF